jgi:phosphatidylglycerol phospholipase C
MGPLGYRFLDNARAANKLVFVWTVNEPRLMRRWIRKGVDGVITDDPEEFKRICDSWDGKQQLDVEDDRISFRQYVELVAIALAVLLFGWILKNRHRYRKRPPLAMADQADKLADDVFQKA